MDLNTKIPEEYEGRTLKEVVIDMANRLEQLDRRSKQTQIDTATLLYFFCVYLPQKYNDALTQHIGDDLTGLIK